MRAFDDPGLVGDELFLADRGTFNEPLDTPCARQHHATIRNRLAAVPEDLAESGLPVTTDPNQLSNPSDNTVFLNSAYV